MSETASENKNDKRKWLLVLLALLLALLLIFVCVFGYRQFGKDGKLFSQVESTQEAQPVQGVDASSAGDSAQGSETDQPDYQVNPVDFDDPVYYTGVEFADPMDLEMEFIEANAFADGSAVLTFGASGGGGSGGNGGLPPGEYTAKVDTGIGEPVVYDCGLNSAEPDKVFCFGPAIAKDTPVAVEISYTSADFVLAGGVKGALSGATAGNLPFDFGEFNAAADALDLGKVDNPYEAWGVIGCCIQNIGPDGVPVGCENILNGLGLGPEDNGSVEEIFDGSEDPEQAWQELMDQYHAPQDWTGSPGSLNPTAQQAIFDSANACAAALGLPEDQAIDDLYESRMLFEIMWAMDWRRDTSDGPGGFWGAVNDFFSYVADSITGVFELLFTGDWPEGGVFDTLKPLMADIAWLNCMGNQAVFNMDEFSLEGTSDECLELVEEEFYPGEGDGWEEVEELLQQLGENYVPPDQMPPQACLDYIDYAKEHTYFAMGSSGFVGNEYVYAGTPMAYCAEAMGFGYTPEEIRPYMDTNYMYDKIIEAYGHVGNPAMPDPCRMVAQWCDSDQYDQMQYTGKAVAQGSYQGAFANLNGCNDPQSFAEAEAWMGSQDGPPCEAIGAILDVFSGATGVEVSPSPYCMEVEAFENSPLGDVAACAERLGYSGAPMTTAGEYLDFLAWIGTMDALDDELEWSDECWTAIQFSKRFGFVEQSVNLAASSCSQGGPQKLNKSPIEFSMPAVIVPVFDSGGKSGNNGEGGSCRPNGTSCNTCGTNSCVIWNCNCVPLN